MLPIKTTRIFLFLLFLLSSTLFAYQPQIVSEKLLNYNHLKTAWINNLVLGKGEAVDKLFVMDEDIYVLTSHNTLFCLSKKNGMIRFVMPVAAEGLPVFEPKLHENRLFLIAANNLLVIDTDIGTRLHKQRIKFSVTAAAAPNAAYLYIAGMDKRLHAMDREAKFQQFAVAAADNPMITSVVATDSYVIFSTEKGNIVSIPSSGPKKRWQYDAVGEISAPIVLRDSQLYAASRDTNLYKLDAKTGRLEWLVRTESPLITEPRVTGTTVYQYAEDKGLYAVNIADGKVVWLLENGVDLLAEDGLKAYVATNDGLCAVMDNKTGKKLYSINFSKVSHFVANTLDSAMYLLDNAGQIVCVKPVRQKN